MKENLARTAQALAGSAFDDAMRRLVRVPKSEADAEERQYQKMRKRLRDKKAKRKPKN